MLSVNDMKLVVICECICGTGVANVVDGFEHQDGTFDDANCTLCMLKLLMLPITSGSIMDFCYANSARQTQSAKLRDVSYEFII